MNGLDIAILVCLCLPALLGIVYGFLNILLSIIAWVCAAAIAVLASPYFAPMLDQHIENPLLRDILAFVGLFVIALLLLTAMAYVIVRLFGQARLNATDRILGLFLGAGLGGCIVAVLVFLAGFTALTGNAWWRQSILIQPFQQAAVWGSQFLPQDVAAHHRYSAAD